jgi:uncharacterized protein YkwD
VASTAPPPPPPTTAPPAPPPPRAATAPDLAQRAFELVNQARRDNGLGPLAWNGGAAAVAQAWSAHMAGSGLAHNPSLSGDLAARGVTGWHDIGENVGYAGTVDQVHARFMASPAHRANILSSQYDSVGVGVASAGGFVWVTLDFVG